MYKFLRNNLFVYIHIEINLNKSRCSRIYIGELPEAVATACEKCNLKQRQGARKISNHLKEHRPELWAAFLEKYDPNKEYIADFEQFLAQVEE